MNINDTNNIVDWFTRRGITEKTLKDFDVSVNDVSIVIPVHNEEGIFLYNKYRRLPHIYKGPKYTYDTGGKAQLYGQQNLKKSDRFVITEGEMDCLVLNSHQIPAVSSTGGANTFFPEWVELLKDKEVTICFDNDEPGGKGMARMYKLFPNAKFVFVPEDSKVKDISDYFNRGGDVHKLMKTGIHFDSLVDIEKNMNERNANWQQTYFHKQVIKDNLPEPTPTKITIPRKNLDELERAKDIPISSLISVPTHGENKNKVNCLWHTENTPSMHIYKKTNTFYCWGCGKHGDSVEIAMKVHNITFVEALVLLNK